MSVQNPVWSRRQFLLQSSLAGAAVAQTGLHTIPGLPQHKFYFDASYEHGKPTILQFAGTVGFLIQPHRSADQARRWVWISPLWLALRSDYTPRDISHRYYVEALLDAGFHVVGLDVGTTCGSPAGARVYQRFYKEVLMGKYKLHPRARMIGQSNGGLISYAWAFRHPKHVDRIFGIYPATDIRSWPGLHKVAGGPPEPEGKGAVTTVPHPPDQTPGRITPAGLAYPVATVDELSKRLKEFNPIDNLEPLARARVKIFHVHGDKDALVPMGPNSEELLRRYHAFGGEAELEVLPGLGHGGREFYHSERGLRFLLG